MRSVIRTIGMITAPHFQKQAEIKEVNRSNPIPNAKSTAPILFDKVELNASLDASLASWQKQANYSDSPNLLFRVQDKEIRNYKVLDLIKSPKNGLLILEGLLEDIYLHLNYIDKRHPDLTKRLDQFYNTYKAAHTDEKKLKILEEVLPFLKSQSDEGLKSFFDRPAKFRISVPLSLKEFHSLATTESEIAPFYKQAFNELLNHHVRAGKLLPISAETQKELNQWRIHQTIATVSHSSPIEIERISQRIPSEIFASPRLEIRLNLSGQLCLTTPLQKFSVQLPNAADKLIPQNIPHPVSKDSVVDANKNFKGLDQCTDWVFGKVDTAELLCKNAQVTSAHLNIMVALPHTTFELHYNPKYWESRFGIKDFPKYMQSEADRLGIKVKLTFKVQDFGINDEYEGMVWSRDYKLAAPTNRTQKWTKKESDEVQTYPGGIKLPINGGGMYPVGRYLFLSNSFFQDSAANGPLSAKDRSTVIQKFERTLGRKVIPLGNGTIEDAPPYNGSQHIDLYMMFLPQPGKEGNLTIALPDLKAASDLIKNARITPEELQKGVRKESLLGLRLSVLNAPQSDGYSPWDQGTSEVAVDKSKISIKESTGPAEARPDQKYYDRLAKQLEKQGFNVIRLPMLAQGLDVGDGKVWMQTANQFNGFVEVKDKPSSVTIPSYGVKVIDEAIVKKLNQLGYSVTFIHGVQEFSATSGPHCLTNDRRTAPGGK